MKQKVDPISDKNNPIQKPTEGLLGCNTVTFITQSVKTKAIDSFKLCDGNFYHEGRPKYPPFTCIINGIGEIK